ncbi:hypothetical protein LOTGIDRAFT_169699 [Lottia gigantea]|uniref:C2 domain-containing protein n=1 Tax=Lottia gigantea TaxID=225164 RepID=V3ZG01_LOTGI|nr:hypothetical protein LOTGIDRAFT_169699 [Lottia gigantea]ESO83062.1 hypothetical protein LOTGIDRAFT_169699 [Lottia gigantea]
MSLQIIVIGATNVPNPETFGECDPYASITFLGQKKKTEVVKSEINPNWNQTLEFDLQGVPAKSTDEVTIEVKDWERVGRNRLLGSVKFKLNELTKGGVQSKSMTQNLLDANNRPHQSQIKLKVTYAPPAGKGGGSGSQTEGSQGNPEFLYFLVNK